MAMIKLDIGDYVNTDYIERLWMINEQDGFIRFVNAPDVPISENDRGRIVKAMKPKIMFNDDLPVIPKDVSEWLTWCKRKHHSLKDALDGETRVSEETFARAWVLGVWSVEETGEIVKLGVEK